MKSLSALESDRFTTECNDIDVELAKQLSDEVLEITPEVRSNPSLLFNRISVLRSQLLTTYRSRQDSMSINFTEEKSSATEETKQSPSPSEDSFLADGDLKAVQSKAK